MWLELRRTRVAVAKALTVSSKQVRTLLLIVFSVEWLLPDRSVLASGAFSAPCLPLAYTHPRTQAARAQKEELRAALTMATCAGVFACCWFSVVVAFFCGLFGAELTLLWDAINLVRAPQPPATAVVSHPVRLPATPPCDSLFARSVIGLLVRSEFRVR